jgi:cytochrome P450
MLMDPKVWGDPDTFRPERFLSNEAESLPNPLVVIFGFGMRYVVLTARLPLLLITVWDRVCPGMYLADRTGFHIAAKTVAAFDITPVPGKDRPRPELVEYTDAAFRRVPLSGYIKVFLITLVDCLSDLNVTLFLGTLAPWGY